MIMGNEYSYSLSKLHKNIMQINNVDICNEYVEDISAETFLNIDNLYKLYQYFMEILRADAPHKWDQARKCAEFYKTFEGTCYLGSDDLFCKGIEKFRNGYNLTLIKANDCAPYNFLQPFPKRPEKSANTIATAAITAISFASIMTYKVNKRYR
ncbi:hypothetical protein PVMG_06014 [Plasmodium vivax Mauritania I]|uniref:PIR Superfamily Protein n=1 Tax=Plasmodium vivax Mauritania I TaxID=1035515 RepID=A0A0J9TK52_PLAVI|nr:hypothetical protein PVMG_06014 [Plasmodium vivax Mauritania I]